MALAIGDNPKPHEISFLVGSLTTAARSRLSTIICALALLSGLSQYGFAQAPTTYYVATNGNNNFSGTRESPSGNDGPFQTISKAQQVIRARIASGMTADITVLIRGGEYFQDFQLNFAPADSGISGFKVIYRNYPGEQPVIHRGRKLAGWQLDSGGIYKAAVDWTFNALYENGVRAVKARYPNVTPSSSYIYSTTAATITGSETKQFGFRAGDIPVVSDPAALEVVLWNGGPDGIYNWFRDDWTVSSIDYSARIVTLLKDLTTNNSGRGYAIGTGTRYFVQGAKELLDQPGEFWVGNGFVYYWPRKTPIDQQTILAPGPAGGGLFGFFGNSASDTVHDIQMEGLALAYTDRYQDAISLRNVERIVIKATHILNTGGDGIQLIGAAKNNLIQGNLIHDIGYAGVRATGLSGSGGADPSLNVIDNNHIFQVGQVTPDGAGIVLARANANTITHNLVHDTPRFSINVSGALQATNAPLAAISANNTIAYNDVSRAMTDSQDGGPLYIWGAGPGNVINNNRVHDSDIPFSYGQGIYLDDDNYQSTVSNNLIHDLQQHSGGITFSGIHLKGTGPRAVNNVVAQNHLSSGELQINKTSGLIPSQSAQILRNIFASNNVDRFYSFTAFDETQVQAADNNLLQHDVGAYNVGFGFSQSYAQTGDQSTKETLAQWRAGHGMKFDQNSLVADPKFVDSARRDFRLRPDSPAYGLGFLDIDYAAIGLTADFPFADAADPLARLFVTTTGSGPGATIHLSGADTVKLIVTARSRAGYLVNVPNFMAVFTSDKPDIAIVDSQGNITGKNPGMATIAISVTNAGVSTSTVIFAVVGGSSALTNKNSASYALGLIAPDMIAFGEAPSIAAGLVVAPDGPWPATLGGVHMDITDSQGQTRAAPIYFVTMTALSYLVPAGTALGTATAKLTSASGAVLTNTITVERVVPGLFTANSTGSGVAAGLAIRVAPGGAQTVSYLFDLANRDLPVNLDLNAPGDVYLSLYGTGFRGAAGPATATVGGISVPVLGFAAVPIYQGEDVVNIGPLPKTLASGVKNVVLTFGENVANPVTVGIR